MPRSSSDRPSRERDKIGDKYRLRRSLGEGTYGVVYEAVNTWTGRAVAVKVLHPVLATDGGIAQRFLREAKAAARFSHPNIVDVLDMGEDPGDGALYIVMELLQGEDLRHALDQRRRFTPHDALTLLAPVMDALAGLHAQGVVHRDIKPANIFLVTDPQGQVRPILIDFGMARLLEPGNSDFVTRTGQMIGTPRYMAPEQVRGDRELDGRADIWSLGVVLYELLVGVAPFDAPSVPEVLSQIRTGHPPPLALDAMGIKPSLAAIVHRAMAHDRDRRFPDIGSFLNALEGEVPDLPRRVTRAPARIRGKKLPQPPAVPRRRMVAAAMGALAVLVGGAWWMIPRLAKNYPVDVTVRPATAMVSVDGVTAGQGSVHRLLPLDGQRHVLRAVAPGYIPCTVTFCDAPPPRVLELVTDGRRSE